MNRKGFSLVELVVIIAIIGILLAIAPLNFHDYQVKYNIEKQVREMQSDLENLRLTAIHQKQNFGVVIQSNGYTFKSYTSAGEADAAGAPGSAKTFSYSIQTDGGVIRFDERGLANVAGQQIWVLPAGNNAPFDSLVVSTAKTNIGKRQSDGTCKFK